MQAGIAQLYSAGLRSGWSGVRFPAEAGNFSLHHCVQVSRPVLGPTQPPIQRVPRPLSLGVKRPGRESDHSPPSSAEVKTAWNYTSNSPIRLYGVVIIKKAQRQFYLYFKCDVFSGTCVSDFKMLRTSDPFYKSSAVNWFLFFFFIFSTALYQLNNYKASTQRPCRIVKTVPKYSGNPRSDSKTGGRLSWLRHFVIFLSTSRQVLIVCLKIGEDQDLPHACQSFLAVFPFDTVQTTHLSKRRLINYETHQV
jgi:hypothetical protein